MYKFLKETLIFACTLALFFVLFILLCPLTMFFVIMFLCNVIYAHYGDVVVGISILPLFFCAIMYYYVLLKLLGISADEVGEGMMMGM